jgi:hypothetical protein
MECRMPIKTCKLYNGPNGNYGVEKCNTEMKNSLEGSTVDLNCEKKELSSLKLESRLIESMQFKEQGRKK